jgi:hypothetical protein
MALHDGKDDELIKKFTEAASAWNAMKARMRNWGTHPCGGSPLDIILWPLRCVFAVVSPFWIDFAARTLRTLRLSRKEQNGTGTKSNA